MKTLIATLAALACSVSLLAKEPDRRLATAKTAFVEAGDALSDDRPIAVCLGEHLTKTTPLTLAESKVSADIVLRIFKSSISGDSTRSLLGSMGLARIEAVAPDGTKLWDGYENMSSSNKLDMIKTADVPCALADALADKLRQGMRKARDKK
jgi:hypothetical protein